MTMRGRQMTTAPTGRATCQGRCRTQKKSKKNFWLGQVMPSAAIAPDRKKPVQPALDPTEDARSTVSGCPGRVPTMAGVLSSPSPLCCPHRLPTRARSPMHGLSTRRIGILSCITAWQALFRRVTCLCSVSRFSGTHLSWRLLTETC